jgi:hypothetical protein
MVQKDPQQPTTQASGELDPPRRPPPTAVGAATPVPPGPERRRRARSQGPLLRALRALEVAVFGVRRTVGRRPGRTPTF